MADETVDLKRWMPTSLKEMRLHGWEEPDVILFSGDAYVDHPSFAAAVVGRFLESLGLHVAVVPQPNWRDDLRDFKKLGRPRLFFGVSAGAMDSMVNKYTAHKRLRSEDAYTPDGRNDMRPEYPTIVYTQCLKKLFPDVPVVIGGIEASLRRITHYDYWQNKLMPSMLSLSGADMLIYGMGELPLEELVRRLRSGERLTEMEDLPQTVIKRPTTVVEVTNNDLVLHSHEECLRDGKMQAVNFRHIEEESNSIHAKRLLQRISTDTIIVNPPFPPMTESQIDRSFDLPYTRMPHPRYKGKRIAAYEMIRHSINIHRGCFGGCAFCTISAHQGKFIASRSEASILREAEAVTRMPDFKGYISDVGGPSANMYRMKGKNPAICEQCKKPSCIHPKVCPNLNADHAPLTRLLHKVDALPGVKKSFIGSGVRYDLLLEPYREENLKKAAEMYAEELIVKHVSGRLKVAPEHTSRRVLDIMRKPDFKLFYDFKRLFDRVNTEAGLRQQLIPYFISSHPGCTTEDMAELAAITKDLGFRLEQVQDFTPTPMTVASEIYYSGIHPYDRKPVYTAISERDKKAQSQFFFWYKPDERQRLIQELRKMNRPDLIDKLFSHTVQTRHTDKPFHTTPKNKNASPEHRGARGKHAQSSKK